MDLVYKGLIAFILEHTNIEQGNVRQGFQNRTTLPANKDFCLISFLFTKKNMRNLIDNNTTTEITNHKELITSTFQLDFYGDNCNSNANTIRLLLEDYLSCEFLIDYGCQPLGCSDLRNYTGDTILNEQYSKRCGFDVEINYYNLVDITEPYFNNVNLTTKTVTQE